MEFKSTVAKNIFLFLVGGFCYGCIEMIYKGNTHISMIAAGGLSFLFIGRMNETKREPSIIAQMVLSGIIITTVEFITGVIVNLWLDLYVWDYSHLPYNFMGQICLLFSVLWCLLSLLAILFDDVLKHYLFGEPWHKYHLI